MLEIATVKCTIYDNNILNKLNMISITSISIYHYDVIIIILWKLNRPARRI